MVRVLVVEDEANIREMIALNLRLAGMEAVEAESAEAALPLLEQKTKWKPAFIRNLSRAAGIFLTFNIVCFGWLMFRAESMQTVQLMLHQIFENFNAPMIPQVLAGYAAVFALIAAGYVLHLLPGRVDALAQRIVVHAPLVLQVVMAAAMIWCVMQIKSSDIQPFIYFQF